MATRQVIYRTSWKLRGDFAHTASPSTRCRLPPAGFSPLLRFTPPGARAQSRFRPVSWLAGHDLGSAFSPQGRNPSRQWHLDQARRLQLRGQPPFGSSRFSPLGPPSSVGCHTSIRRRRKCLRSPRLRRDRNGWKGGQLPDPASRGACRTQTWRSFSVGPGDHRTPTSGWRSLPPVP
jgi:hypothetical protein